MPSVPQISPRYIRDNQGDNYPDTGGSHIEREVAIKVLNLFALVSAGNELDVMLARFRREAKLAAHIRHPSVVEIYDYGVLEERDSPYTIMEVLDGHDLDDEIEHTGPLDPERFLPLFVDCLEALGDAHEMEIIHSPDYS